MSSENTQNTPKKPTPLFERFIGAAKSISLAIVNKKLLPALVVAAFVVGAAMIHTTGNEYEKFKDYQKTMEAITHVEDKVSVNELNAITEIRYELSDAMRDVRAQLGKQISPNSEGYMRQMVYAYGLDTILSDDEIRAVNKLYEFKVELKGIANEMLDNMKHPNASVKESLDTRYADISSRYDAFLATKEYKSVADLVVTVYIASKFAEAMEKNNTGIGHADNKEQSDDASSGSFGEAMQSVINQIVENKYPNVSTSMQDAFDRVINKIHDKAINRIVNEPSS